MKKHLRGRKTTLSLWLSGSHAGWQVQAQVSRRVQRLDEAGAGSWKDTCVQLCQSTSISNSKDQSLLTAKAYRPWLKFGKNDACCWGKGLFRFWRRRRHERGEQGALTKGANWQIAESGFWQTTIRRELKNLVGKYSYWNYWGLLGIIFKQFFSGELVIDHYTSFNEVIFVPSWDFDCKPFEDVFVAIFKTLWGRVGWCVLYSYHGILRNIFIFILFEFGVLSFWKCRGKWSWTTNPYF